MDSLLSQLFLIRKRTAVWVLLAVWTLTSILFAYILPYIAFTTGSAFGPEHEVGQIVLSTLLPSNLVSTLLTGFPFFGGVMVFILGVLVMGSEYNWGTLTPMFIQRAGRLKIFFSKMIALAIAVIPFVLVVFLLGAIASSLIALHQGESMAMPPAWDVIRAMSMAWFIMVVWTYFGVLLAILWRGTTLPVGLGIVYGLVVEGVIAAFGSQIDLLDQIAKGFLRTNGYSLITALAPSVQGRALGPGGFSGPFVPWGQALLVLAGYIVLFTAISAVILQQRDVN
ncbi:MAG: ABC transporter permease [Actinobacteria bacterium]|nr:ABC transporter permease [Actinomycetota bacterium]MCL5882484.1 ABC transporter permease [Actinomycetota bacterium]